MVDQMNRQSTLRHKDSSVYLIYHDPKDLGSLILIQIISTERTLSLLKRVSNINVLLTISIHNQEKRSGELTKLSQRGNAMVFSQILSTHSLRKSVKIGLENLHADVKV